ncbi:unnamed protein product, partial [Brassica oleracea var. botrytis]
MAKQELHFSELEAGRCRNFVVTSLLRFWEPRNVKKGGELLDVDLVVLMERHGIAHPVYTSQGSHKLRVCVGKERARSFWIGKRKQREIVPMTRAGSVQ